MLLATLAQPASQKARIILVVDDNKAFCDNLEELLQSAGHRSTCVYDGYGAIESVKKERPDFILMDIRMPGLDGVTTFRKIKQVMPNVKVIMMTGYTVDATVQDAIDEGALAVFGKPLDIDKLLELIQAK